jgi:hypothetical protein
MTEPQAITRLLWTAGWDSTFRLLVALLVRRKAVQPYYLIDPDRPSTPDELHAMQRITAAIADRHADAARLLRGPVVAKVTDLHPDPAVTGQFQRLRSRSHLGGQYDWLARFAGQQGLSELELAIHRDDRAHAFLEPHVVRDDCGGDPCYRLRDDPPDPDLRLFARFRFPVFDKTKRDMQREAADFGFADLMELTWFCHVPTPDGRPCGRCNPCRYTIEEGLGRRVPLPGRLRYYRGRLLKQIKRPLRYAARLAGLITSSAPPGDPAPDLVTVPAANTVPTSPVADRNTQDGTLNLRTP